MKEPNQLLKFPRNPLTRAQLQELGRLVVSFIDDELIACPESIMQRDGVTDNAPELIEALAKVVGFYAEPKYFDAVPMSAEAAIPYIVRSAHGVVQPGIPVRIWRTPTDGIRLRAFVRDVRKHMHANNPKLEGKASDDTLVFDYFGARAYYLAGVEQPNSRIPF